MYKDQEVQFAMTADLMCKEHVQSHYSDAAGGVGEFIFSQHFIHYWTSAVHLLQFNNSFNVWGLEDFSGGRVSLCSWPERLVTFLSPHPTSKDC